MLHFNITLSEGSRKRHQKEKEEKKGKRRLQVAQADETEESTVLDAEVQSAALEDLRKKRVCMTQFGDRLHSYTF